MKRYLLFGFYHYYPSGGANDFVESYSTLEEANQACKEYIESHTQSGANILDAETGELC